MPAGVLALIVALAMLLLLPFLLADAMVSALLELGIAPRVATLLVIGIFVGSLFNVPVWRRAGAAVLGIRHCCRTSTASTSLPSAGATSATPKP